MKVCLAILLLFPVVAAGRPAAAGELPNVVFLLADDLGWTGLGSFGSDLYETPHLDALAATGMKFTSAYAACMVCSPTRASIMTGMYPARLHLTDFIAGQNRPWARLQIPEWTKRLEHRHVTIAEALQDAGYVTAQVGKWHLSGGNEGAAGDPVAHGFDSQHLKPAEAKGYFLPTGFNQDGESKSDYLTDYLTDQAVDFIDQNHQQPFFLYFAYHTPHTPIQGRADLVERYQARVQPEATHNNPTFAAMVHSLDQSVGRILDRLSQHGISDNTIVIFTSDNGGLTQRYGKLDHFTANDPLRRGKGSAYEGGVRVPAIVRWPRITPPGSTCDEPISSIDYYPTILKMTSSPGSETHNTKVDGVDLGPLLRDPQAELDRDLFWHYPHYHAGGDGPYSAIRSGNWRLIQFYEQDRTELYDLSKDLSESTNLADQQPAVVQQLSQRLNEWKDQVGAQLPTENPNYDPEKANQVGKRR